MRHLEADLFHAPYYLYPFAAPGPTVVTIHDLIPLDHPDPSAGLLARWLYKPLHRIAERRAAAILTDSEAARASLLQHLSIEPSRIAVVPLAPDPRFQADRTVPRDRFLFTLSSTKPHKNSERLLRAYAATRPMEHGVPLLVAGLPPDDWEPLAALARARGVGEWVRALGRLNDDDLRDHYQRCLAFLFPSYAEGFGLPVLEALACGAPTLIANRPPMVDLVAGAALTADPFELASLTGGIERLLHEPELRARLGTRGPGRAAAFTWHQTARQTMAVYQRVLAGRPVAGARR
jgi:alpha-1,3-rhamnosyl/mannosyltransferase